MKLGIKAVFVDVGGTLLTNAGEPYWVSGEDPNIGVVHQLIASGISFNLVTGLGAEMVDKIVGKAFLDPYLMLAKYVILENGAAIYRNKDGSVVFNSDHLDKAWAGRIQRERRQLKTIVEQLSKKNLIFRRFEYSVRLTITSNNLSDYEVKQFLVDRPVGIQSRLAFGSIIYSPAMASKEAALRFIAEKEGWNLQHVMAIGNERVDECMLRTIGHPRAPSNSAEEVKKLVLGLGGCVSEYPAGQAVHEFLLSVF